MALCGQDLEIKLLIAFHRLYGRTAHILLLSPLDDDEILWHS